MARRAKLAQNSLFPSTDVGFEKELWRAADTLRGSMDAAEYKHVVLGLVFLKYVSDAFEEQRRKLEAERDAGADPEDPDEYRAVNIFWVPSEARWSNLRAHAKQPTIGRVVDDAMTAIERDNPALKGVLPKDYGRPSLDKTRLGQLIDLISNIHVGNEDARSRDVLGRVYEYFLGQFASAEGKKGGEFYTPRCVVKLLVEMIEPYHGRVYDPCCGSAGMFVQSMEFIRAHATGNGNGGRAKGDISIYGQELNYTTWRLAKMNLALRGIDGQVAHGDTFHNDHFPDLKADYILANPPFNVSEWGGELLRNDQRWKYGVPPKGNANFAWVQHMIHHLAPGGVAGFVLANGSMSSNQSGEGEIRKNIIEADLVECMVAMPDRLFYSTMIPCCLWFLARDKSGRAGAHGGAFPPGGAPLRDRRGEVLFIDARSMGRRIGKYRELTDEDIRRIADTYHAWRAACVGTERDAAAAGNVGAGSPRPEYNAGAISPRPEYNAGAISPRPEYNAGAVSPRPEYNAGAERPVDAGLPGMGGDVGAGSPRPYHDIPGFCKSATIEEIRKHGYVLTPGRYVGAAPDETSDDDEPFEEKMRRLVAQLREQQAEAMRLDEAISRNLKELGYGG